MLGLNFYEVDKGTCQRHFKPILWG